MHCEKRVEKRGDRRHALVDLENACMCDISRWPLMYEATTVAANAVKWEILQLSLMGGHNNEEALPELAAPRFVFR